MAEPGAALQAHWDLGTGVWDRSTQGWVWVASSCPSLGCCR